MAQDSLAVANHLLRASKEFDAPLDNLKLQKLLYYAHGSWYPLNTEGLLDEAIQAWTWGPVVYSVYDEFKRFGSAQLDARAVGPDGRIARLGNDSEGTEVRRFLEAIAWVNRKKSGMELAHETHRQGTPWRRVVEKNKGKLSHFEQIPEDLIRQYFTSLERADELRRIKAVMRSLREQE